MKIGDKVRCIKSCSYTDYKGVQYSYTLNNNYEIIWLTDKHVNIKCDNNLCVTFYLIGKNIECDSFNTYFSTLREQRKLKLKKIYESR